MRIEGNSNVTTVLLHEVERIAQEAGAFIAREGAQFSRSRVETKGKHDFVSYVDKSAEGMILPALRSLLPEAGILSEEGGSADEGASWRWIVDPLDGTTNFIHGMPMHAVSIGLAHGSEVVLGVIYEVSLRETFSALRGHGATLNGLPIRASGCMRVDDALVGTGFPYSDYSRIEPFFATMHHFMHHSHGLRRLGSAATDLAYVACGRLDAFYEYGLKPWDVAAGIAICREAGVLLSDFRGGADILHGGEILCAAPGLFEEFRNDIMVIMNPSER